MSKIKIEKGVKIPIRLASAKYPLEKMEVGDSFVVPIKVGANIGATVKSWGDRQDPVRKFSRRKIDNKTVRVWRVA